MIFKSRSLGLCLLTIGVTVITFLLKPVPQSLAYHHFADRRLLAGIPNFANVVSNLPFVIVGIIGLVKLKKEIAPVFVITYALMFLGILVTGFGSAYYHLDPNNDSLVYDRLPITIVIMTILSATLSESVSERVGGLLLLPLMMVGTGSVLWWIHTEHRGAGDLRGYGLVQYYPVLLIPLLIVLYPSRAGQLSMGKDASKVRGSRGGTRRGGWLLIGAVSWYVVAKLCEYFDRELFVLTGFISGHTVKHLFSAVSTWLLVRLFEVKHG